MRFVEDDVIERLVFELQGVLAQRAVGGDDEIVIIKVLGRLAALLARVIEQAQPWREAQCFGFPVEDQRARHHQQ